MGGPAEPSRVAIGNPVNMHRAWLWPEQMPSLYRPRPTPGLDTRDAGLDTRIAAPAGSRPSGAPARVTRPPQEQHQRAGGKRTLQDSPGCRPAVGGPGQLPPGWSLWNSSRKHTHNLVNRQLPNGWNGSYFLRANMTADVVKARSGLFMRLASTPCAANNESSRSPQEERPPRGSRDLPDSSVRPPRECRHDQRRASHRRPAGS
jgi:hypothetical protein